MKKEKLLLFGIFAKEIWDVILKNVCSSNDYYSICRATLLINQLLQSKRVLALFANVAKILVQRCVDSEDTVFRILDDKGKDPRDETTTDLIQLSKVRQVCPMWALDHALQNKPSSFHFSYDGITIAMPYFAHYFSTRFETSGDPEKFQRHFGDTHGKTGANPFPAREIIIHLHEQEVKLEVFYCQCLDLLRRYGKYVWHFSLTAALTESTQQCQLYLNLRKMFKEMPNIKTIKFKINENNLQTNALQKLLQTYEKHSTLKLANLKYIDQRGMPPELFEGLLSFNLPKIQQIGTKIDDFVAFGEFCKTPISLIELSLDLEDLQASWSAIFSVLEQNFQETLNELYLKLPNLDYFIHEDHLKLGKLRKLHVWLVIRVPLDFLLSLTQNLEELVVVISAPNILYKKDEYNTERVIKFHRYNKDLYLSNIWEIFPVLDELTLKHPEAMESWNFTWREWRARRKNCRVNGHAKIQRKDGVVYVKPDKRRLTDIFHRDHESISVQHVNETSCVDLFCSYAVKD